MTSLLHGVFLFMAFMDIPASWRNPDQQLRVSVHPHVRTNRKWALGQTVSYLSVEVEKHLPKNITALANQALENQGLIFNDGRPSGATAIMRDWQPHFPDATCGAIISP